MSVFSQLFSQGNCKNVTDPKEMPWAVGLETKIGLGATDGSAYYNIQPLSGAGAWAEIANWGATAQVTVDDTYVTALNVASGSGLLFDLMLPGGTAPSDIVTCRITIDGTVHTVPFTLTAATDRVVMGPVRDLGLTVSGGLAFSGFTWDGGGFNSWAATSDPVSNSMIISPTEHVGSFPVIRFETSLLIEMKSSDVSVTNERDFCGVVYRLD